MPVIMNKPRAELVEIFSSVQGEGMLVGLRQVFIRFSRCNLSCTYCDTESRSPVENCLIESTPGRRDFVPVVNPVPLERILSRITGWQRGWPAIHHSISITGGEPLIHHNVLMEWLPELRKLLPIYLETNGVLHKELVRLIPHIDHVGMDMKLPSASGCKDLWEHHREFLRIASEKNVFVKAVVDSSTEDWEIVRACEIIASVDLTIPLILQPVTLPDGTVAISPLRSLELQEIAGGYLAEVRIIPQTHKFIGQL